jgi:DNA-binding LacI/PurR family transcriptional regulator
MRRPPYAVERSLLLITNNRERVFQRGIIEGATQIGRERGYRLDVLEMPRRNEAAERLEDALASRAGVMLVADVLPDEAVARLHASGLPLTLVSHRVADLDVPAIMHDNRQGIALLCGELLDRRGCRNPVFIMGSGRQQDADEREEAYRRELMRRDLPIDESRFLPGQFEPEQAAAALAGFLADGGSLDGLLAADYLMAIACLAVLRSSGLDVPEDVAVLGFGDGPEAAAAGLTTVAADVVELGRRGARQVIGQVEGLRVRGLTLLSTTIVARDSTGRIRPPLSGVAGV